MSDFWSDLGAAIRKTANDVSTEVSIAGKEQKLKEEFQSLGRMHYRCVKQGSEPCGPEFTAQMEKISLLQQEINHMRDSKRVPSDADFEDMT